MDGGVKRERMKRANHPQKELLCSQNFFGSIYSELFLLHICLALPCHVMSLTSTAQSARFVSPHHRFRSVIHHRFAFTSLVSSICPHWFLIILSSSLLSLCSNVGIVFILRVCWPSVDFGFFSVPGRVLLTPIEYKLNRTLTELEDVDEGLSG